jgi:MFS transporter, CP family, cyanate transporter
VHLLDAATKPVSRHVVLAGTGLLAVAVALAALNLRISVTSVSSVLSDVRRDLTATTAWSSAVTAAPSVCFGLAALCAPWLARRLGGGPAIAASLALLVTGLVVRVLDGPSLLLMGTFAASVGIAVCNVLIPVAVSESFPKRLGLVTGVYSASLAAGSAIAATATPPLDTAAGGWRPALAAWAIPAVLALALWLISARQSGEVVAKGRISGIRRSLYRVPLAWVMTVLFASQSIYAYVIMGWLPQMLRDAGVDRDTAGALLGVAMIIAVPLNLLVPPIAARRRGQSGVVVVLSVVPAFGVVGMILWPAALPLLWTVLLGIGTSAFPVTLTMMSLRTRHSGDTARLSAMTQGIGYLLAAGGPFAAGLLYGALGDWTVPLILVLGVLTLQAVLGTVAGRPRQI